MKSSATGLLLVLSLSLGTNLAVASQKGRHAPRTETRALVPTVVAQQSISAEEAAALVQARTGGRILAVELTRVQGRAVYRIKVLTPGGAVRIFYVDAATGAM